MAACGSLQHIFEKPLPENPTLLESLSSWNQLKPVKPVEQPSFTEIFGELHFKENSQSSSSSSSSLSPSFPISPFSSSSSFLDITPKLNKNDGFHNSLFSSALKNQYTGCHKKGDGFSPMKYESLQLCTEGLGFESSDDVEDLNSTINEDRQYQEERVGNTRHHYAASENSLSGEFRRSARSTGAALPPPISCIGNTGKPSVCFKSYRHDGRFVLKQVKIPNQEFLHACREDGRLKLHFVQQNDEILEEEEEEEEEEESEEENYTNEDEEEENEGN